MKRKPIAQHSLTLKTKLQLSFLLIGLLSISVTGWQTFETARDALETLTSDRLTSLREMKKRQIESHFEQIRNQVITFSEDRMIIEATRKFIPAFRQIVGNHTLDGNPGKFLSLTSKQTARSEYFRIHSYYHPILQNFLRRFGYEDILIVDAKTGNIVYSVIKKSDFATSLLSGPYRETNIAKVFSDAQQAPEPSFARIADFAPYAPSGNVPASFIASPIFDGKNKIGVLLFQMSIKLINQVMTSNNHWRDEGLGETGETYIVGADYKMRTDSRFFIQEPDEYFRRLLKTGTDSSIIRQIKLQATSILLQEVHTSATIDALKGKTDTRIINDYRGIPVLSSYTPLNIPGVQWVILAEIDTSEAFSSVHLLRERLILLGLAILFVSAVVGVVITRTISKPILSLARATEKFGKGDLSHRASPESDDEIGLLAETFNRMAENTMQNTAQLQREIIERRRAENQVTTSHERLRNLSAHLQTVREEERKGIAREIHDELGQALTTLKLNLVLLKDDAGFSNPRIGGKISSMVDLIDATIKSVKRMITALRPRLLDDLGLSAAIEWQSGEFQQRTGIACNVSIYPENIKVDPERSTAIFRILQETLTNVARHSNATSVDVSLTQNDGELELLVSDNGKGITNDQVNDSKSFGLIGIRERAYYWGGNVEIRGSQGRGTVIVVRFPLRSEVFQ
ncbi:MAG: HAMP domain-containing protein [Bacteroidota bacterium]|jgi:signal transduction histidine kinase